MLFEYLLVVRDSPCHTLHQRLHTPPQYHTSRTHPDARVCMHNCAHAATKRTTIQWRRIIADALSVTPAPISTSSWWSVGCVLVCWSNGRAHVHVRVRVVGWVYAHVCVLCVPVFFEMPHRQICNYPIQNICAAPAQHAHTQGDNRHANAMMLW